MEPERWREIERVYHIAREQPSERRTGLIRELCGADADLLREVESLLNESAGAEQFLQQAVLEAASSIRASSTPRDSSITGRVLSHYRVLESLGHGGMGIVYRAEDLRLGRFVALKVLSGDLAGEPVAIERFQREAQAAAAINHPNVCTVFEADEDAGARFLVMELLEGATLKDLLAGEPVFLPVLLDWAAQIATGLAAAHARGVIHRDIKPANLFVTREGNVKILDFGLAKVAPLFPASLYTLTSPNATLGTVAYMSPEQARGESVDARTDVFSFGAVLYEMVSGRRAFEGETMGVIFDAILNRDVVAPSKFNSNLPAGLEKVIRTALQKDRERRYRTAAELLEDLRAVVRNPVAARGARIRSRFWLTAACALLIAAPAAVYFRRGRPARLLGGNETIVLADFTNTTGDPVFDGALRRGLSAQLEQSPFLTLLSDARVGQILRLMTYPTDARLTQKLAREVCERSGSAATIEGSIANAGAGYALSLRGVDCRSGAVLAEEQVTARGKRQVLPALGEAASKLRRKLGESLASVQRFDAPPRDVTTDSLEALDLYNRGYRAHILRYDLQAAIPLFQQAVRIDPNFAMAFATMGSCFSNTGETERSAENLRRAYELRGRVSQNEKFYIGWRYEYDVTGDLEAARREGESFTQAYPRDSSAWNVLSIADYFLGDYPKAVAAAQESVRLNPSSGLVYCTLTMGYLALNRLDEARATASRARELGVWKANRYLYEIDYLQRDRAAMEKDAAALRSRSGYEHIVLGMEACAAAHAGQFDKARRLNRLAAEAGLRTNQKESAANVLAWGALDDALVGNAGPARQQARAAVALSGGWMADSWAAAALALSGDSVAAKRVAGDLDRHFPKGTMIQRWHLPMIEASLLLGGHLRKGAAEKAAAFLENAVRQGPSPIDAAYLHGQALLAAGRAEPAAAEFQYILDHPGVAVNLYDFQIAVVGDLAHLGLGRAYALAGKNDKARLAYQDFLALWKDADAALPLLRQAKAEYARLIPRQEEAAGPR